MVMRKYLSTLMVILVVVGCGNKQDQINISDDRIMNNSTINNIMLKYFSHKEFDEIKYYIMEVNEANDSLKIMISPLIQKRDVLGSLPSSYVTFDDKNIFVKLPLYYFLPVDDKSVTVVKYRELVKNIPEYVNTVGKNYFTLRILIKNNKYKVDSFEYVPNIKPGFRFVPPVIPENQDSQ